MNATGCLEIITTPYPDNAWEIPWFHSLFGNTAAVATGVAAAKRVKGHHDIRTIAQGGDGGTTDIGFGCLSGMFERNDDVLYICYDNQAYMNTGVQRSSATPPAARTATTPPVGDEPGNVFGTGKNVPMIAMAHRIPYVATATIADLRDLEAKVIKAINIRGARYIHILVPCPLGWGARVERRRAHGAPCVRKAAFSGLRSGNGEIISTQPLPAHVNVEEYLMPQRRFAHLFKKGQPADGRVERLQAMADENIRRFNLIPEGTC